MDMLASFADLVALSPQTYTRPILLKSTFVEGQLLEKFVFQGTKSMYFKIYDYFDGFSFEFIIHE